MCAVIPLHRSKWMLSQLFSSLHVLRVAPEGYPHTRRLLRSPKAVVRLKTGRQLLERMVWTPVHPDGNDIGVVSDAHRLCFVRVCAAIGAGAAGFPAYADRYWVTVCVIARLPGPDNIEIEGKTQPIIKRRLQKSFDMITPI